ncbi:Transcriptional regulator, TetR family protein [Alloalcanivorax dieselolei B5]|uniref:Transcriptional regulator, TetR family protein n=1 Tax=Alcanivorax dieselolei (strain DSM 16502 / CGMCC 1.3690 / MCCC 1A00001 / B-5) TaxID=930169 RepID=K0CHH4_ALCDB|nr:TetR/AcrR family transcriptional regulator [Alloalcanivorax dieselolei]AFT71790.1 Transcriptional regulator, TetR family protein [Alloalcanivorax dieselolei B5]GGK02382.1 TetR family transcriptional regulator [Alloalcanivorax dieselolei]
MTSTYHHGDLYRQALEQALALLHEEGAAAVTLRALARRLQVTAPALYRHFRNRDSLLAALAEYGFRELRRQLLAVRRDDALEQLTGIGQAYIAFAQARPNLYRLMFGGQLLPRGAHPDLDAAGLGAFAVLQQSIDDALAAGYLNGQPAGPLTAAAWSLVHGFAELTIDGHLPDEQQAPGLAALVTRLLLPGGPSSRHNNTP